MSIIKNVNFAPNENFTAAAQALVVLLQPWKFFSKKEVNQLKKKISQLFFTKSENVYCFLSARAALKVFLESLNVPLNSEVLVVGFTCEAVVLPILKMGLQPVYVDVENETLSLDNDDVAAKVSDKTKVIILQHSFGMTPQNREKIMQIAARTKCIVIEDLAHGFHLNIFSKTNTSSPTESVKLLSFGRSKLLSAVHGGALIVPDTYNSARLKTLHSSLTYPSRLFIVKALLYKIITPVIKVSYGVVLGKLLHKLLFSAGLFTQEISKIEKGGQYDSWLEKKLPAALATLLVQQVKAYPQTIAQRIVAADQISKLVKNPFISSQPLLRYPVLVKNRGDVQKKLAQKKIVVGNWYTQPVAPAGLDLDTVGYTLGSCKQAEKVCNQIINLPLDMSKQQLQVVREVLRET